MKLQCGNVVNMAVADQKACMCHCASYIMYFQKVIVYNIPTVGEEGLLAYCDLMSFEFSLQQTFHFDTGVIFFLY